MSGAWIGGVAAIIAAQKKKEDEQKEEEQMTQYQSDDMNNWEFKIVRSALGKFKNHEAVRTVCEEEAVNGWELVEKFDNYRIRFKRKTEHRSRDQFAKTDPYRSCRGTDAARVGMILGLTMLLLGAVLFFIVANDKMEIQPPIFIGVLILLVGAAAAIIAKAKKK